MAASRQQAGPDPRDRISRLDATRVLKKKKQIKINSAARVLGGVEALTGRPTLV